MTRTTKRFLSIVLTAMMLFTLIPTSALANDFTDYDEIAYTETLDVIVALGVVEGMLPETTYEPEGVLSRQQAAKIVAYLKLGEECITPAYVHTFNEDLGYSHEATPNGDGGYEFVFTQSGVYDAGFRYNEQDGAFRIVIDDGYVSSSSSEQTMYTVAVVGTTVNAKKVAPGTEVELSDFTEALAAVTPTGDSVQGLYFDAGFTQPADGKFTVNSNTTLYPKLTLASNKTEVILNENGEADTLQVTGPTGTTVTYTASGTQVDVSQQNQAKLVTMAQANTGKANNTVYIATTPAKKEKVVPVVGAGLRYEYTPDRFADVPVWAEGYVNLAASLGLVTGRGDGVFDPKGDVTGVEFAKMMLVALGYDADKEQFIGTDWALNANALGFLDGLEGNLTQPLSREDIAQMIFNTLTEEKITFSLDASTARDIAAAGGQLVFVTAVGTAIIDNENTAKLGEAVQYTTANGEQYVDKKVQFTIAKDKVAITKDGEPATAVKAAFTAHDGIFYVGPTANTVYITMITDGNRVESLNTIDWSNKDMAEEIVNLITTERGSQGNTKIVTTSDSMLEELTGMKR